MGCGVRAWGVVISGLWMCVVWRGDLLCERYIYIYVLHTVWVLEHRERREIPVV